MEILSTIVKICNQTKCPMTDEWIVKDEGVICVYAYIYTHTSKNKDEASNIVP